MLVSCVCFPVASSIVQRSACPAWISVLLTSSRVPSGEKAGWECTARIADFLLHFSFAVEDRDLLELRPARRWKREEPFAIGAHVPQTVRDLALLTEQHFGFRKRKARRRVHLGNHHGLIARQVVEFLAVAAPERRAEGAVGNLPWPVGRFRINRSNEHFRSVGFIDHDV